MAIDVLNPLDLIASERNRQVKLLGYDAAHDDTHTEGELAQAAAVYAMPVALRPYASPEAVAPMWWPFEAEAYRPGPDPADGWDAVAVHQARIHDLVRAAALCCAEIERLQRLQRAGAGA